MIRLLPCPISGEGETHMLKEKAFFHLKAADHLLFMLKLLCIFLLTKSTCKLNGRSAVKKPFYMEAVMIVKSIKYMISAANLGFSLILKNVENVLSMSGNL